MPNLRPIPAPTPDTQPYWDAAHAHRLAIQRCARCRRWYHPPVAVCPACGAEELAFENVSGRGRIYTYSIMYDRRVHGFEERVPYVSLWVELEEQPGLLVIGNLLEVRPEEAKIGLSVMVAFEELNGQITLPQFRLAE